MFELVLFLSSLTLSSLITWYVLKNAARLNLIQEINHRSSHIQPTPGGGGIGFVLTTSLFTLLILNNESYMLLVQIILALVLALLGFLDDQHHLPVRVRFFMQFFVLIALLLIIDELPEFRLFVVDFSGYLLSFLALILGLWWLNLFNFMDGIDGLAVSQALYMFVATAGIAFYTNPDVLSSVYFLWIVVVSGALTGFLVFNLPPASIFMGDVGSLWLGFVIFSFALITIQSGLLAYEPWIIAGALFVSDATVTLIIRMIKKEPWREGHRNHAYQRLSRLWRSHRAVLLLAMAINILWLLPLAIFSVLWVEYSGVIAFIAYLPVIAGCVIINIGQISQKTGD